MDIVLQRVVQKMPKAELHIHIEGSLEPELIFELARRNDVSLKFPSVEALRDAYDFRDLQSFLDIYYAGASVLLQEQDFYDMTRAYLTRAHQDHIRHVELFFDPQTHTSRGVPFADVINGIHRALLDARTDWDMTGAIIMCFLRHLPEADAFKTLEESLPHRNKFIAVGLDSSELGYPPENFERVFAACRDLGLRLVAHAGEEGPPDYIRAALDVLKVERIDHGVRCLEDPLLTARLARGQIPLTVCPLSNIKLRVFDRLEDHNVLKLIEAGLLVTINSDDPAYFGGYLNDNFMAIFKALPLELQHARQLAHNSFKAAFIDAPTRDKYLAEVNAHFDAVMQGA